MGGLAYTLKVAAGGRDLDRLQRKVWNILYRRIGALATSKASRRVDFEYLHVAADDLASGRWFVKGSALVFAFGDAAGLCYAEMYATRHWVELVALDTWATLALAARDHGTSFVGPEDVAGELARLLGPAERVFFPVGGVLAYAKPTAEPADSHLVETSADSTTLGALPARERAVAERAIRTGICSCDVCTKLRKCYHVAVAEGAPAAPAKAKRPAAKKRAAAPAPSPVAPARAASAASLEDALVLERPSPKSLDAGANAPGGVAIDWRVEHGDKAPKAVLSRLPTLPLRALGLAGHGMRAVPSEVLACAALEVLGLHAVDLKKCPSELARLSSLRALDLSWNKLDPSDVAELVGALPALEVVDFDDWGRATPPSLGRHRALRHLNLWRECGTTPFIEGLPLESLIASEPVADLRKLPLRFLYVTTDVTVPALPRLEVLALGGEGPLPGWVRGMTGLRALLLDGIDELPAWLGELPLELLTLRGDGLDAGVDRFRVIERLESLRALSLIGGGDLSFDLRRLASLEVLLVQGEKMREIAAFPGGLAKLGKLRAVVGDFGALELGAVERAAPRGCRVAREVNGIRVLDPVDVFRASRLGPSAPEWWLSRFRKGGDFVGLADALSQKAQR